MANRVVEILRVIPPATLAAEIISRAGGSTPAESLTLFRFDASTIWYMDFLCRLSDGYGGGGLSWTTPWMAETATTNATRLGIAIRRLADDADDFDVSHTYDFNDVDDTAPSAAGEFSYPTITMTDGADMDSWAAGELAIVRLRRNASHANDNMSGYAQVAMPIGVETGT